jgi:hypothetical protein
VTCRFDSKKISCTSRTKKRRWRRFGDRFGDRRPVRGDRFGEGERESVESAITLACTGLSGLGARARAMS